MGDQLLRSKDGETNFQRVDILNKLKVWWRIVNTTNSFRRNHILMSGYNLNNDGAMKENLILENSELLKKSNPLTET